MNKQNAALVQPPIPAELGLEFVRPEPDQIKALEYEIGCVATELGKSAPELLLPEQGLLSSPLDSRQMAYLDKMLDPVYGNFFTAMQDGVRGLKIHETNEKMASVYVAFNEAGVQASFSELPINEYGGIYAGQPKIFYARETVVRMHVDAARALGSIGINLQFEDAFRPQSVQEGLFQMAINLAALACPKLSPEEIITQARSKVAVTPFFAGHKGGAATDLSLIERKTGQRLDNGHEYLHLGSCVVLDFPYLTYEQLRARKLFEVTMKLAGMDVYPGEDWHTSFGDIGAAMASGDPSSYIVQYGPIKDFDRTTGEVEPLEVELYHQQFPFEVN